MNGSLQSDERPSATLSGRRFLAALVFVMLCGTPAAADEYFLETPDGLLVFQNAQDMNEYLDWFASSARAAWLYIAENRAKPCFRGQDDVCQQSALVLRDRQPAVLKKVRIVTPGARDPFLLALRNGNFIYPVAPSFLLLKSIVIQSGNCGSWSATANDLLKVKSGALKTLSAEAETELPPSSTFPERHLLHGSKGSPGLLELARGCRE